MTPALGEIIPIHCLAWLGYHGSLTVGKFFAARGISYGYVP